VESKLSSYFDATCFTTPPIIGADGIGTAFGNSATGIVDGVSNLKSSKQAPIGWHTLRRSLATLLISNGENVKVAQSQLRHTTPKITLELYAQAVSADQQKAHRKVVQMVLPAKFPEKLKERSAAPTA
jgi:hypothetical protein